MGVELELQSSNGNFSFTGPNREFLDVEEGAGMEPGDPTFTEKVFARSLLKEGATLALETLHEKEMIFPVKLHADSKAELTKLVQEINMIMHTQGAIVLWKDEGASVPTFFTLISGQFDDEFDFRLGQNNWLKGKIRLFTQPLGYLNRNGARALEVAGVATTIQGGTTPVIVFQADDSLMGDADSLLQTQVIFTKPKSGINQLYAAVSVLPSASYTPFISAASFAERRGTLTDVLAPGGTYTHFVNEAGFARFFIDEGPSRYAYCGDQRILVAARTPSLASSYTLQLTANGEELDTAIPVNATSGWQLYDMGVISVSSSILAMGEKYLLQLHYIEGMGASRAVDIAGIIQLPESSTCWLNMLGTEKYLTEVDGYVTFDGVANQILLNGNIGVPASGILPERRQSYEVMSGYARGAIPQVRTSSEAPVFAVLAAEINNSMNLPAKINFNVLERCRYAF